MRILVVEDDVKLAAYLEQALREDGYPAPVMKPPITVKTVHPALQPRDGRLNLALAGSHVTENLGGAVGAQEHRI